MLMFLQFSENDSGTFTHSLSLDTFNVYMHLTLSFVIHTELLPLILKISFRHFSRFVIVISLLVGVTSSKTATELL